MEAVDTRDIERMMRRTGGDEEQCRFFLEASGGDFERAVDMFQEQIPNSEPRAIERVVSDREDGSGTARNGQLLPIVAFPISAVAFALRFVMRSIAIGASIIEAVGRRILPAPLIASIRSLFNRRPLTALEAARKFTEDFERKYGARHPDWEVSSWREAATLAHRDGKLLFVYLHAPRHQDTDQFCRDTLCEPAFVDYVNSTFVSWGGNLRTPDAMHLAGSVHAASYPYCGLLALSGARTRLIFASEGIISASNLSTALQAALTEHAPLLQQEASERARREMDRLLREEQDQELQRSLEADRERELQRKKAAEAEAEEERKRLEEAQQAEMAVAEEERKRIEAAEIVAARREKKSAILSPEPEADVTGVALIRVRLPNGIAEQRRFLSSDPLEKIYDWVDSLDSHNHLKYALATTYPRKVFKGSTMLRKSLTELELVPQAALLVQPEDDD